MGSIDIVILFANPLTETTPRIAMMWAAIVLLVVCPIAIVAFARTKRRVRELETAERLADSGFSAADIAKALTASREPLGKNTAPVDSAAQEDHSGDDRSRDA